MRRWVLLVLALVGFVGCQSAITSAPVAIGASPDEVRAAMGRPLRVENPGADEAWIYRDHPRDPNDYVRAGFRRRVEFDPIRKSNVIIVEPVDDRLFRHLRTHTIRVAFRDGRVASIVSTEDL